MSLQTPRVTPARPAPAAPAASPRAGGTPGRGPAGKAHVPALPLARTLHAGGSAAAEGGAATARTRSGRPAAPAAAQSSPTPRTLLKGESVVSYLSRPAGTPAGALTARSARGGAHALAPSPSARVVSPSRGRSSTTSPHIKRSSTGGVPRGGEVDVDKWLADRRAKEDERERVKLQRAHMDARFIERLERQQEVRNAALADEEARKRTAAAAAASWQAKPYTPVEDSAAEAKPLDATEEEALLRRDAERLFGTASMTPPAVIMSSGTMRLGAAAAGDRPHASAASAASAAQPPGAPEGAHAALAPATPAAPAEAPAAAAT